MNTISVKNKDGNGLALSMQVSDEHLADAVRFAESLGGEVKKPTQIQEQHVKAVKKKRSKFKREPLGDDEQPPQIFGDD